MSWSLIWAPLAVLALTSLLGWAVARWLSRMVLFVLVVALVVASVAVTGFALFSSDPYSVFYIAWVVTVLLPAAMGLIIGAMLVMRTTR